MFNDHIILLFRISLIKSFPAQQARRSQHLLAHQTSSNNMKPSSSFPNLLHYEEATSRHINFSFPSRTRTSISSPLLILFFSTLPNPFYIHAFLKLSSSVHIPNLDVINSSSSLLSELAAFLWSSSARLHCPLLLLLFFLNFVPYFIHYFYTLIRMSLIIPKHCIRSLSQ